MTSRSIICRSRGPRQINDLRDTDISRYFAITEFNNWFDHRVCFHIYFTLWEFREEICHFSSKSVVTITHEQNIICSKIHLDGITHEQTIILGSHMQVTWWALGQWKGRKKCFELWVWSCTWRYWPSKLSTRVAHVINTEKEHSECILHAWRLPNYLPIVLKWNLQTFAKRFCSKGLWTNTERYLCFFSKQNQTSLVRLVLLSAVIELTKSWSSSNCVELPNQSQTIERSRMNGVRQSPIRERDPSSISFGLVRRARSVNSLFDKLHFFFECILFFRSIEEKNN